MKYLPNGDAICEFSVGVKSGFGDKEKTLWVKCSMFGKRAAGQLPQYLVKGTKVCIGGELSMDEWEKDGVKNKMLKLKVAELDLIGDKKEGQQPQQNFAPQQQQGGYQQQPQQQQQQMAPQQSQNPQNAAYVQQPQQQGFAPQGQQQGFPQHQG